MRPWVLLRQAGIPFEEAKIRVDPFDAGSEFKQKAGSVNPAGKAYIERRCALPGVKAWMDDALAENDFRDFEEPYRLKR